MFDWFKKSSGDSERHQRRERASEAKPAFRPAELPPVRPEPPKTPTAASPAVHFKHAEFVFQLAGDWVPIANQSQTQFIWESGATNSSVVISVFPIKAPQERLVDVANKVLESREQAERDARNGQKFQFGDKWVQLRPSNDVAEVAYAGYDETGMIFRFFGFVTQRKVLSLWVATKTRDNDLAKRIFDEAFRGLKFYVP